MSGQITSGHARAILSVVDSAEQRILFGRIVGNGLSVRESEQLAGELNNKEKNPSKKSPVLKNDDRDPNLLAMEQKFVEVLGTKVVLKGNLNRGSLQIEYFSGEDLERLYSIFTKA